MSWLERARRREGSHTAASSEPLVKNTSLVDHAESGLIGREDIEYVNVRGKGRWVRYPGFIFKLWPSFILFVALPALAITYYFAFVAADQYVVQARFVVRQVEDTAFKGTVKFDTTQSGAGASNKSPTQDTKTSSSKGGRSSSITTDDQDGFVVASYIGSGAIINQIAKNLDVRSLFQRPEADFWARLKDHSSQEDFARYWLDMVNAYVDRQSGIVTLEIRAFRRADALALSKDIIANVSQLLNDMSLRARDDALARAKQEVGRSEKAMQSVMVEMEAFRNREGLIDPANVAVNTNDLLKQLLSQRIETDSELYVTRKMRGGAPNIPAMESRLKSLDAQIAELQSTLTAKHAKGATISATLVKFDELEVKEQLARQMYVDARVSEEQARRTAENRWLYLAVFQPPVLPDDSEYPDRIAFPAIAAIVLFAFWSTGALIWASVLDHRT